MQITEAPTIAMMKIQARETGGEWILQVQGRLAGAYVPELETCWKQARASRPGRKIALDLKNVTCVDQAGRYLLEVMHVDGVRFVGAGLALEDVLKQVMG